MTKKVDFLNQGWMSCASYLIIIKVKCFHSVIRCSKHNRLRQWRSQWGGIQGLKPHRHRENFFSVEMQYFPFFTKITTTFIINKPPHKFLAMPLNSGDSTAQSVLAWLPSTLVVLAPLYTHNVIDVSWNRLPCKLQHKFILLSMPLCRHQLKVTQLRHALVLSSIGKHLHLKRCYINVHLHITSFS